MRDLRHYQRGAVLAASLTALWGAPAVRAQTPVPPAPPAPVTGKDAGRLGVFALASLAVMPADRDLQRVLQRRWMQDSPFASQTADLFNAYGSPGVFAASAALYAAGWAAGRTDLARTGLRAFEAIGLSGIVTGGIKGIAGRARPYASPGEPGDWKVLSGTNNDRRQSFPSGHVTAAFAFASALDHELKLSHPKTAQWAGPALYTAAALTGFARMHSNNHWASDVVMGAGVGWVSGMVVARFHANRPQHWIDTRLLPDEH